MDIGWYHYNDGIFIQRVFQLQVNVGHFPCLGNKNGTGAGPSVL